jgi:hypothetical protein
MEGNDEKNHGQCQTNRRSQIFTFLQLHYLIHPDHQQIKLIPEILR